MLLSTLHADPINTNICYSAMDTHTFAQLVFINSTQYVLCFHHCPLTSGISRVTHEKRLSECAHGPISLSDQMIQKRLHWLYMSSFSIFLLCTTSHGSICFFFFPQSSRSTVLWMLWTVSPCRVLAGKIGLTSQTVSLFKGLTLTLSCTILSRRH